MVRGPTTTSPAETEQGSAIPQLKGQRASSGESEGAGAREDSGMASYRQGQGGRDTHVSMAKKIRGEGIRSCPVRGRGAGGGLATAGVWLGRGGTVETRGTGTYSTPSCARWRSERATSGIVKFPSPRGTNRKTASPLGLSGRGQHNKIRITQRRQPFLYKFCRKARVHQVFDEMTKALNISEKSPKFTVG